jgi:hypothetical protein
MLKLIEQAEKDFGALNKPTSGLNMELPSERAKRIADAQANRDRLYEQYKAKYGVDLRGSSTPAKPQGAPGSAPKVVPQGNARPKFSKGPGVSAQIAKLKEGTEFEVDGSVFVLQGGKAVPR